MKNYVVTFTQYYSYQVEANNEQDAENNAYGLFKQEMYYPVANTSYDELEIECLDEDEDEEDY